MEPRVEHQMAEKEPSDSTTRKRIRQSISVPFVWEVIPGTPKKDWKPTPLPAKPVAPPVKFIASVPFQWEEKPGTPLPCFKQSPPSAPLSLPQAEINIFLPSPGHSRGKQNNWCGINDQDDDEIVTEALESDSETCQYETDDSFSSAPSLLANGLISTMAISRAVPSQEGFTKDLNNGQLRSPASPASETDSTSSYATGTASLTGTSFLEWLFPLLSPHSSFLDHDGCSENRVPHIQTKKECKDFVPERNYSTAMRRPPTLGELIMMSRRRSYQSKAIQMRTQNLSKEIMKRNAFGCCILGTSNILGRFDLKWKRQLQIKLI